MKLTHLELFEVDPPEEQKPPWGARVTLGDDALAAFGATPAEALLELAASLDRNTADGGATLFRTARLQLEIPI